MNTGPDATPPKRQCPECGAGIDANYPEGLCPRCLLRLARHAFDHSAFPPPHPLSLGDFADYELLSEIGHGGMGVVYQARQKSLDRIVALKMLLGGQFADASARARFRSEAEITAQLQHPNIVAIHEVGEHDHLPFFTMDYVEGRSLAEVARDRPLTPAAAAGYLSIIARAIAYAHERGVLHRDLKPSNILIDGSDQPRITDFGLAKRLTGSTTSLTLSGEALGSPNFMPPEQAAGRHKEIGPASDVYGLGAILYYLVTSRPPFIADNLSLAVRQVQDQEPVSPRMLNPGVPKDLETICLKCLQKETAKRYATAGELADELDRFRRGEPILGRPVGTVGRAWRWCRRRPALAAALAGVFILAIVSTTAAVRMAIEREGRERERYRANIQLAAARIEEGSIDVALETLLDCPERFRHWEWGYLVAQCHREVMTLEEAKTSQLADGFFSSDWRCGFSSDGKRVGAIHVSGIAQVWELPSGKPLWSLRESVDKEPGVLWLPDWSAVTVAKSNVVEVVDMSSGSRRQLRGHSFGIRCLAVSSDGRRVAAAAADDTVRIWEITDGREVGTFPIIPQCVRLFFNSAGDRLVASSRKDAAAYDCETGTEWSRLADKLGSNYDVWPDPEAGRFVTLSVDSENPGQAYLWSTTGLVTRLGSIDVRRADFNPDRSAFCLSGSFENATVRSSVTGDILYTIPANVHSAAFSPDSWRLATRAGTPIIRIWETSGGTALLQLRGHQEFVHDLAFSPDGLMLASVSVNGTVKIWSALPGRENLWQRSRPWGLDCAADGRTIATAPRMDRIAIWDATSGQQLADLRRPRHMTLAMAFSPDQRRLATGDVFGEIAIWEIATGRLLHAARGHEFMVIGGVAYSPDGRFLATAANDGTVRIWAAESLEPLRVLDHEAPSIESIDFSSDNRRLASTDGNHIRIWRVETGQCERELRGHSDAVLAVRFSPDGNRVASGSSDGTLRLWDVRSGRTRSVWRMRGNQDPRCIGFSPDGKRIALRLAQGQGVIAGDVSTLEIWDVETSRQLLACRGDSEIGFQVRFSHDGRRLVTDDRVLNRLRQWESFPWTDAEYPGPRSQPLRERIRLHAQRYWHDRLEAEHRGAETNATLVINLPFDRSRVPRRDPTAGPQLVDLTEYYTSNLDECGYINHPLVQTMIDLRNAPSGLVDFHGIQFDLRGIVQLRMDRLDPFWAMQPRSVEQIPVRQHGQRWHAVLGCVAVAAEGEVVGAFVLHYADGSQCELEILYGRHFRHWKTYQEALHDPRTDTDLARVAWEGPHAAPHVHPTRVRIYHAVWDNPRPDQEIVSFDFVSKFSNAAAPFLMAVTVE